MLYHIRNNYTATMHHAEEKNPRRESVLQFGSDQQIQRPSLILPAEEKYIIDLHIFTVVHINNESFISPRLCSNCVHTTSFDQF